MEWSFSLSSKAGTSKPAPRVPLCKLALVHPCGTVQGGATLTTPAVSPAKAVPEFSWWRASIRLFSAMTPWHNIRRRTARWRPSPEQKQPIEAPERVILEGCGRLMSGANKLFLLREVTKPRALVLGERHSNIPWTPQQLVSEHRVNPEAWPGAESGSKPLHDCDLGSVPWGEDHVASDRTRQPTEFLPFSSSAARLRSNPPFQRRQRTEPWM